MMAKNAAVVRRVGSRVQNLLLNWVIKEEAEKKLGSVVVEEMQIAEPF